MAIAFVALALAASVEAKDVWFGPVIGLPVPAEDVGDDQFGIDLGVTLHDMSHAPIGFGLDIVYHHWPASPQYMSEFDRYLRGWYRTFDSPTWAFDALQISGHVKVVGPGIRGHSPWVQVGAGILGQRRGLGDPDWEGAVVSVVGGGPNDVAFVPCWHGAIGVDFRASPTLMIGLNATYRALVAQDDKSVWGDSIRIPGFSAISVGTHLLFVR